ncbi:unnamed protein product [Acanthoscelides obtectus]|uniref:Uncharacterized protein n=1 Tax=Acanthoscelides obtectus TaxID=200917 RepID=A0A9P0PPW5_ACAOB|nr:unnamed protein product [Acanthoscelides obtectus]CAK1669528.1 hypothetical protein AOBTE_LOCUS27055 [Acanthoscelides obtectus]
MKLYPGQVCFAGMPNLKEGMFHWLMNRSDRPCSSVTC